MIFSASLSPSTSRNSSNPKALSASMISAAFLFSVIFAGSLSTGSFSQEENRGNRLLPGHPYI